MEVYVSVKNFGKIREARVNISNFTVFVGNNNSGKTQLMELIYTIIKRASTLAPDITIPQIQDIDAFHIGEKEIRELNQCLNQYLEKHIDEIIEDTFNAAIPIDEITVEFADIDNSYDIYFLTDKTVEYMLAKDLISQGQLTDILLNRKQFYRSLVRKNDRKGREERHTVNEFSNSIPIEVAKNIIISSILGELLGGESPLSPNVLFLPASRMGLMLLYKHYFGNTGQDKNKMIRDKNQNSKGITKPVLDFLSFLLQYSYTERVAKKNEKIIDFISEHLIDGTISEKGEITMYTPRDQKKEIPVYVASSMVNEVVPIIKALTDSDAINYIFYDEVETSMHPLKQAEMVKMLNRLNNNGIKLIVSTHSDTMATKINNLMLLSHGNLDKNEIKMVLDRNGVSITEEDLLISRNIHVYQFINHSDGKSSVQELEFRKVPCTGYDFTLFNDSTMNLFEEAKIVMGIEDEN